MSPCKVEYEKIAMVDLVTKMNFEIDLSAVEPLGHLKADLMKEFGYPDVRFFFPHSKQPFTKMNAKVLATFKPDAEKVLFFDSGPKSVQSQPEPTAAEPVATTGASSAPVATTGASSAPTPLSTGAGSAPLSPVGTGDSGAPTPSPTIGGTATQLAAGNSPHTPVRTGNSGASTPSLIIGGTATPLAVGSEPHTPWDAHSAQPRSPPMQHRITESPTAWQDSPISNSDVDALYEMDPST